MAAILEPRPHHGNPIPGAHRSASRPPRHLSAVTLPVGAGGHRRPAPASVAMPVEPLVTPAMVAGAVAAVLVAVVLALGIGQGAFSALVPTPGAEPITAAESTFVVVEPGDSLWSIARSLQPEGDVRPLVHRIAQANGPGPLQPGQQIVVPR